MWDVAVGSVLAGVGLGVWFWKKWRKQHCHQNNGVKAEAQEEMKMNETEEEQQQKSKKKIPLQYLKNSQVVVIDYQDLLRDDVDFRFAFGFVFAFAFAFAFGSISISISISLNSEPLEAAYGFEGLGILAVRGVPRLRVLRQNLLPLAAKYAALLYRFIGFCLIGFGHQST